MTLTGQYPSRRTAGKWLAAGLLACGGGRAMAATPADILMDGHVHITNRLYWEKIDAWQAQDRGWDFARAWQSGVNCIIENVGTHGYWNYNYSPKQTLRLLETIHAFAERHADKLTIALNAADARKIIAAGRMAIFLGCEAGWDTEGDSDVLAAFHRLGLRTVQFATQTGFNAFVDSAAAPLNGQPVDRYQGLNTRGRALVAKMNELGILIDITHASESAQRQIITASRAPVVASHETLAAVSGAGLADDLVKALAAKGGVIGIHGAAAVVGKRYRKWLADNPDKAKQSSAASFAMLSHKAADIRAPGDHGEYITEFDAETERLIRAVGEWKEFPEAVPLIPTADEWAEHVDHVIKTAGADHVAIGLDMTAGRSGVPANAGGYGELVAALKRVTTSQNVRKITGENWLRALDQAKAV